jgi:hypothetical protein
MASVSPETFIGTAAALRLAPEEPVEEGRALSRRRWRGRADSSGVIVRAIELAQLGLVEVRLLSRDVVLVGSFGLGGTEGPPNRLCRNRGIRSNCHAHSVRARRERVKARWSR